MAALLATAGLISLSSEALLVAIAAKFFPVLRITDPAYGLPARRLLPILREALAAQGPDIPDVGLLIIRLTAPRQEDCADPMSLRADRTIEPDQAVALGRPLLILFTALPALTLDRPSTAFTPMRARTAEQLLAATVHVLLTLRTSVAAAVRELDVIARTMLLATLPEPVFSVARILLAARLESSPANVATALDSARPARRAVGPDHLLVADANALAATRLTFAPAEALIASTLRLIVVVRAALWGIVSPAIAFPACLASVAANSAAEAVNALVSWLP